MRFLVEADLVSELYVARYEWVRDADTLIETAKSSQLVEVYATEIGLDKTRNYLRYANKSNLLEIENIVRGLAELFSNRVITIDRADIEAARATSVKNMDAAIELVCAKRMNCDGIITQQPEKFSQAGLIQVLSLSDLLNRVQLEQVLMLKKISNKIPLYVIEDFNVYVGADGSVINWLASRYEKRILPTINKYMGDDGGYIACYSHNEEGSIYSIGDSIYVMGQIRLQGHYIGQVFHPQGYENQDISAAQEFKDLCNQIFPACKGDCWAGGDTGGWF